MNDSKFYTWKGAGGPFDLAIDAGVFTPSVLTSRMTPTI